MVVPSGSGAGVFLVFNNAEADKTLAIDYSYAVVDPGAGDVKQVRTETGELQRTNPPAFSATRASADGGCA